MKLAKQIEYSDTPEYDKLVDLMRQRAAESGLNMSDIAIKHNPTRVILQGLDFSSAAISAIASTESDVE